MCNRDFASKQLNMIQNRISLSANNAGREARSITLIGASKGQPSSLIREFHNAGLNSLGENYLQEGLKKTAELSDLPLQWHFIGHIQSNKTKQIAENYDWVHTIDRIKIATRLAQQAPSNKSINALIQLNIDEEDSKSGVNLKDASSLANQIAQLDNIQLRGYMLLPKPRHSFEEQRKPFAVAREALELTNQRYGLHLDQLSMGMSKDLEAAISEGGTMIRVGRDLFGDRPG